MSLEWKIYARWFNTLCFGLSGGIMAEETYENLGI